MKCFFLLLVTSLMNWTASAAKKQAPEIMDAPPSWEELGIRSPEAAQKIKVANPKEEGNRKLAGGVEPTSDTFSKEYKSFVDTLIKIKNPDDFAKLLSKFNDDQSGANKKEDKDYEAAPNDLKFALARMSTMLPFRGVIWRMVPLVHQSLMTQESALSQLRNFAETVSIRFEDSHVSAQMLFFSLPHSGVKFRIESENDFTRFLGREVYWSLSRAIARLEALNDMSWTNSGGARLPIVMDTRIRFGEQAFDSAKTDYFQPDQFKVQGPAERDAIIYRYHRRMAVMAQTIAYDWSGYMKLMDEIGKEHGIGREIAKKALMDYDYVAGLTRSEINSIVRRASYAPLKLLGSNINQPDRGRFWMKRSYDHLRASAISLKRAWDVIKYEKDFDNYMQLDPDLFQGRKEQIQRAVDDMQELFGLNGSSNPTIYGAISGDPLRVSVVSFFTNPPESIKKLLPTGFDNSHATLKNIYGANFREKSGSLGELNVDGQWREFRDYSHGRAIAWDNSEYGKLFPGVTNVAKARRILGETRGVRPLANGILAFVR